MSDIKTSITACKVYICKYSGKFTYETKLEIMKIIMKLKDYKKYIKSYHKDNKGTDIFLDKLPDKTILEIFSIINTENNNLS